MWDVIKVVIIPPRKQNETAKPVVNVMLLLRRERYLRILRYWRGFLSDCGRYIILHPPNRDVTKKPDMIDTPTFDSKNGFKNRSQ
jgi:hypothetical protein